MMNLNNVLYLENQFIFCINGYNQLTISLPVPHHIHVYDTHKSFEDDVDNDFLLAEALSSMFDQCIEYSSNEISIIQNPVQFSLPTENKDYSFVIALLHGGVWRSAAI